jgi:hypothetical protein
MVLSENKKRFQRAWNFLGGEARTIRFERFANVERAVSCSIASVDESFKVISRLTRLTPILFKKELRPPAKSKLDTGILERTGTFLIVVRSILSGLCGSQSRCVEYCLYCKVTMPKYRVNLKQKGKEIHEIGGARNWANS